MWDCLRAARMTNVRESCVRRARLPQCRDQLCSLCAVPGHKIPLERVHAPQRQLSCWLAAMHPRALATRESIGSLYPVRCSRAVAEGAIVSLVLGLSLVATFILVSDPEIPDENRL